MDEKFLCQLGLSSNLAHVYRLLVEKKSLRPAQLVKITYESRTNCYALLDKLVELGLAKKLDVDKKLTYFPESPIMLEKMLSEQAAEAQSKLHSLQNALPRMLSAFNDKKSETRVTQYHGKEELYGMYIQQMEQNDNELHFLRSIADIPYFGLETMKGLRYLANDYKKRRFGITPLVYYAPSDPVQDAKGGLKRTWLPKDSYTAPVEWVVSGDTVHIISFRGDGSGVAIKNQEIAESLRQMLTLFGDYIKKDPAYKIPGEVTVPTQKTIGTLIKNAREEKERVSQTVPKRSSRHGA